LYKLPQLLIVHLKRFKFGGYGGGRKIDSSVNINKSLELDDFVRDSGKFQVTQQDDRTAKYPVYELYGVVEHMGSLNGGHYTS
jgi:ubiquitin carboxyl-terminal hydrolase 8